jgi:adhesin transport system membrane fusion protein
MVLEQQLAQRKQEIVEMTTKASDLRAIIRLSQEEKRMIEPLVAKGSAPKVELIQLERALREKQTELNSVTEAIPRAKSAISEAEARISELRKTGVAQAQTELAAKTAEMNMVKQTLGALEDKKDRTEIKSPVNGTIKDFKINTVGGVVKAGDPIVEIVPVDDNLLVEVKIRPADIGRLRPDLPAMVKITAYDFTIYGGLKAEVVDISADTIKNEKGESFYRVRVRTKENKLRRNGEDLPIIPGMVATVDVLTGHKTVMEYLMKPILKTARNSMNEK